MYGLLQDQDVMMAALWALAGCRQCFQPGQCDLRTIMLTAERGHPHVCAWRGHTRSRPLHQPSGPGLHKDE